MFTKKMMTRIAQIAPLTAVMAISLSPAFARNIGPAVQRQRREIPARVVTVTPAAGAQPGSTLGTAFAASTSNGNHLNPDGGSNGTSTVRGSATPGGGVRAIIASRATARGTWNESPRIAIEPALGTSSVNSGTREKSGIDVSLDPGYDGRARRLHPRDETNGPVLDLDGGFPGGSLDVEEAASTVTDPRQLPRATVHGIHKPALDVAVEILTDPIAPADNGLAGPDGSSLEIVDAASTMSARAARRAARVPQVLLPLIPKSEQAPVAARTTALSRTQFAVGLNGENGLAASASFTFGRH